MLDRFLPRSIDNSFRAPRLALWLFSLVVFVKTAIGLGTIFNGRNAAISADGIPLDTFTPTAVQAFVAVFALWGLAQVTLGALGLFVLFRYRSLIPFMFSLLFTEHLLRRLILRILPIPRIGTPPGTVINQALVGLMVAGLLLSLWTRRGTAPETT